jgi:putative heme-binding domain-containing protein
MGNEVGADLAGLTDKSPGAFLLAILDPNRAVEPKFLSYSAVTTDGRVLQGMLADESGGSLTLLDAEGKKHQILRRDLEELKASGKSLMPEGLEKDISPEAMADLLTYLKESLRQP